MWKKLWKPAAVIVVALTLVLTWGTAYAETRTGEGPFDAMAPTGEWMDVEEGEYHWYVIHYDYDDKKEAIEPLVIKMFAEPYASVNLTVRNQAQVDEWMRDGEQPHFGCCTMVDEDENHDGKFDFAEWAGTLRESGDYYLVVEHAKNVAGPASYRFTVDGPNISFPTMEEEPIKVATPVKAQIPAQALAPVSLTGLAGSAPDYALVPTGALTELPPQKYHWYAFDFDFDEKVTEPVTVRLYAEPFGSTTLTVRNAEQAQLWKDEGEHAHFGCCTTVDVDRDLDGLSDYSVWSGSLRESGRYFIVLELAEGETMPAYYRFTISGENLAFPPSFDAAVAAAAINPQPEPPMPEAVGEAMPAASLEGTGPDFAMAPNSEWHSLDAGGYHWYKFTFDESGDRTQPAMIRFLTEPTDGAILTVRNGRQAEIWRQEGKHEHFGCCVPEEVTKKALNDDDEEEYGAGTEIVKMDYATWSADLTESGVYYLVVEHAENLSEPAFYRIDISGDGLEF